jgi:hypothetical protein
MTMVVSQERRWIPGEEFLIARMLLDAPVQREHELRQRKTKGLARGPGHRAERTAAAHQTRLGLSMILKHVEPAHQLATSKALSEPISIGSPDATSSFSVFLEVCLELKSEGDPFIASADSLC